MISLMPFFKLINLNLKYNKHGTSQFKEDKIMKPKCNIWVDTI